MEQLRDTYLKDASWPDTGQDLSFEGSTDPQMTLELRGYADYLTRFFVSNASTGSVSASTKITDTLALDPNGLFTDVSGIQSNALQVIEQEDGRDALGIIRDVVAKGDANDARWLFGVLDERKCYYYPAPDDKESYEYEISIRDAGLEVEAAGGGNDNVIYPWEVRPGVWAFIPDFIRVTDSGDSPLDEAAFQFIENVRYTAPYGLDLSGSRIKSVRQRLAKLGLGGI